MIGIDTNVLVRYVVRDDEPQYVLAARALEALTEENPGFVTQIVLAELYWVLVRSYRFPAATCLAVIRGLVATASLDFDDAEGLVRALELAEGGADFGDALVHGAMELFGVREAITFDQGAALTLGWRLLGSS